MEERKEAVTIIIFGKKFTSTYIFCREKFSSLMSHENYSDAKISVLKRKKKLLGGQKVSWANRICMYR